VGGAVMNIKRWFKKILGKSHHSDEYKMIEESGLFDEVFYLNVYGNSAPYKTAIEHYLAVGHKLMNDPAPHFSAAYYTSANNDVKVENISPLSHYIKYGEKEGRQPNPYFSPVIYRSSNSDLNNIECTLLSHFIKHGINENRPFSSLVKAQNITQSYSYENWIHNNETLLTKGAIEKIDLFKVKPLISIVVPVYNPDKELLIKCIESVISQSYSNWELCLSDDKSTKEYILPILESYARNDSRIKLIFRPENGHISAASNSALEVTTGEWTALLDHDDELHEHALFHIIDTINAIPEVEFIYSDEDKLNQEGNRIDPHFKPDWNLDLLYSQNYVSHLGVYKTDILKRIGGFRLGYEGSQDYDLLLRYSREIGHENIFHIQKVLYHWRIIEGSTAMNSDEKSYTTDAGIKALKDFFSAETETISIERGMADNIYRVKRKNIEEPLVSLIIPTYNGYEITKQAITSILNKTDYQNYEIILIDNNSDDPVALSYFDEVSLNAKITVLRFPYAFNYSAINNFGVKHSKGEIIGLINNDIEVINSDWLCEMVSQSIREGIGCVGAMLYYPNDTIQHAGVIVGLGGVANHSHKHFKRNHPGYFRRLQSVQNYSAVTAACLLVKKSIFNEVSGLDENNLTVAFNDVDFCLKVKTAGYRNLWTPYAELYHHESVSRGEDDNPIKLARFQGEINYMQKTWKTEGMVDPFYNPNLTNAKEDFSIGTHKV
jgi:glycosyltransferase involved in cell wall biosynthesis